MLTKDGFAAAQEEEKLKVNRTLIGKLVRRSLFFLAYLWAITQERSLRKLLPILQETVDHPWVVGSRLEFIKQPGLKGKPGYATSWDAPVTVTLIATSANQKKKKVTKDALCMSLYVKGDVLFIRQLQGVPRIWIPIELQHWPELFVRACVHFATEEGYREVRLPKAETLHSYHYPGAGGTPEQQLATQTRVRLSMLERYNQSALRLGFTEEERWYVWHIPKKR